MSATRQRRRRRLQRTHPPRSDLLVLGKRTKECEGWGANVTCNQLLYLRRKRKERLFGGRSGLHNFGTEGVGEENGAVGESLAVEPRAGTTYTYILRCC